MSTMNISLPADQVSFVDKLVTELGYANRSELMRAILRFIKHESKVFAQSEAFELRSPSTRSRAKILAGFRSTGLYNKGFIKDLEESLARSDYFTD